MLLVVASAPFAALAQVNSAILSEGQASGSSQFHFRISGAPGAAYVVEASDNLMKWTPVFTNTVSSAGYFDFADSAAGNFQQRFYRAVPSPSVVSVQSLAASFRKDRILIKPKAGIILSVLEQLHALAGVQVLQSYSSMGGLQVLQAPSTSIVSDLIATYRASGLVEYAEPDYQVQSLAVPDDFRYGDGSLWGLHNTGIYGGVPGADIQAQAAWDTQNTASNIIVAVIDTGVRYTHEDLADNMWVNPGEIAGNGVDEDGDGYVDDVHGINAINNSGDPSDDHGHGTHVSGTIGGVGNNSVGVVGGGGGGGADHGVQVSGFLGQRVHFRRHQVHGLRAEQGGEGGQRELGQHEFQFPGVARCDRQSAAGGHYFRGGGGQLGGQQRHQSAVSGQLRSGQHHFGGGDHAHRRAGLFFRLRREHGGSGGAGGGDFLLLERVGQRLQVF
jgi:hypothetical protein